MQNQEKLVCTLTVRIVASPRVGVTDWVDAWAKLLGFLECSLCWYKCSLHGCIEVVKIQDIHLCMLFLCYFKFNKKKWFKEKKNYYQMEFCIKINHSLFLTGRDKLQGNYKATKVCTCSVFKAPDFIRFLIRNKCPHQCRIKRSSHTEWIQNVKVISVDSPMRSM